jgi:hypothetical protein
VVVTQNYIPPVPLCAVAGCTNVGKAHRCPADGADHHHGRIHYTYCGDHGLTFRDDWHLICDEHYAVCLAARRDVDGDDDERRGRS